MKIYLAGKMPKGGEANSTHGWRDRYVQSAPWVEFLSPINPNLDYSDSESVFGHDCHLIKESDAIIVDGSAKLGVGTSQEILVAKYFKKYVICILPHDTHHRRAMINNDGCSEIDDWVHPFIRSTVDKICASEGECIAFLQAIREHGRVFPDAKGIQVIDCAIDYHLGAEANEGLELYHEGMAVKSLASL